MNTKSIIGIIIVVIIVVLVAIWLWKAPATPTEPAMPDQATTSNVAPAGMTETPAVSATAPSAAAQGSGATKKIISTKTVDGMKIEVTKEGTGEPIKNGQTASMLYTGTLADGTVFDASSKHGNQPFAFTLGAGQVIKGWDEGVAGMKVGEERTLIIPSDLAYGPNGIPGAIPPNATLTFQVTLVAIK